MIIRAVYASVRFCVPISPREYCTGRPLCVTLWAEPTFPFSSDYHRPNAAMLVPHRSRFVSDGGCHGGEGLVSFVPKGSPFFSSHQNVTGIPIGCQLYFSPRPVAYIGSSKWLESRWSLVAHRRDGSSSSGHHCLALYEYKLQSGRFSGCRTTVLSIAEHWRLDTVSMTFALLGLLVASILHHCKSFNPVRESQRGRVASTVGMVAALASYH